MFMFDRYHCSLAHDDVIKWTYFLHYWPFVRGIHPQSPVASPHKGQWCRALIFSLICTWTHQMEFIGLYRTLLTCSGRFLDHDFTLYLPINIWKWTMRLKIQDVSQIRFNLTSKPPIVPSPAVGNIHNLICIGKWIYINFVNSSKVSCIILVDNTDCILSCVTHSHDN